MNEPENSEFHESYYTCYCLNDKNEINIIFDENKIV
jgi:hypothetical protein